MDAILTLVAKLRHPLAEVRWNAVTVLGEFGPEAEAAVPALQSLLRDPNDQVARAVPRALCRIRPEIMAVVELG
jgi:HEAT repeat protein